MKTENNNDNVSSSSESNTKNKNSSKKRKQNPVENISAKKRQGNKFEFFVIIFYAFMKQLYNIFSKGNKIVYYTCA